MSLHGAYSFGAEIPGQLPQQALIRFQKQAFGEAEIHGKHCGSAAIKAVPAL
jgi:hypothetical protein